MENGKIMPSGFLEEEVYEAALLELQSGNIRKGLWARAFSESEGNEAKSQALYIKLRVQQEKERIQQGQIIADGNVENLKVADFCLETNQRREQEKNIKIEKSYFINFTNPIVLKLLISSAISFFLVSYTNPENFSLSDISTPQKFGFFVAENLGYSIILLLIFYFAFFRKRGKNVVQVAFICITISTMFGLFFKTNPKYNDTIIKIYNNKKAIANLPVMTDSYTRLDDISLNGSELIYKYTYINVKKDHAGFLDFSGLNLELKTKICSNQINRKALEEGAVFTRNFYGIDGSHLNSFSVSLESCSR